MYNTLHSVYMFYYVQLTNPHSLKPVFKFGTTPFTSTEMNLKKNHHDMYGHMMPYNKTDVTEGVRAIKQG